MSALSINGFPSTDHFVQAKWAPVLLRPILGSPEQLVIGVAAVGNNEFYLERASDLSRLQCLFDGDAATAILAANAGMDSLSADLAARSIQALSDYRAVFSGVRVGELRDAEGESVKAIASSWLRALSSLAPRGNELILDARKELAAVKASAPSARQDRLPLLVFDYVKAKRPEADRFFSREIRDKRIETSNASAVKIDYSGSKIVANFGSLLVSQHKRSVLHITKSLWDLKIDKDGEKGAWAKRDHEMIIQHPSLDDPQFTQKQLDTMGEALLQLEKQADQEEIRLRPMHSVPEIGEHILKLEAA